MKITVVGAGAMGSIYAALLADAGNDVSVIDLWQEHMDAIAHSGLRVEGASGDRVVKNIFATSNSQEVPACDLAIIATKASGVGAAMQAIAPALHQDSVVLTIQNGLGAEARIRQHLGGHRLLLGVAGGFGAAMKGPGHVRHEGMELIRIGEPESAQSDIAEQVAEIWESAGFNVKTYDDINQLVWEKFLCNVTFSGPCTVFNGTVGEIMSDAGKWNIALGCAREAYSVGQAKSINFSFDDLDTYVTQFGEKMPHAKPSMLQDHEAGRASEIDFINGMVPVVAAEENLSAPYNEVISAVVRDREKSF